MKKNLMVIGCLLLFMAGGADAIAGPNRSEKPAIMSAARPLSEILNPDGTVNLGRGSSGSFDPRGFRMIAAPRQAPRFMPEPISTAINQTGGIAVSADGYWDTRFAIPGANGYVVALVAYDGNLYAGGKFRSIGGVMANNIAKWDGTSWSALGSGITGYEYDTGVHAHAVSGTNLYAGGHFRTAGGVAANYVAKWDGTNWSALGSGLDDSVNVLAVSMATDARRNGRGT